MDVARFVEVVVRFVDVFVFLVEVVLTRLVVLAVLVLITELDFAVVG